jgi:putative ABC transport system ATP-binding protein
MHGDVTRIYGTGEASVRALVGVSDAFAPGMFAAIMGPSGPGKSTLVHCLAGLDGVTSGKVLFGEVDLTALNDRRLSILRREQMGFVFQSFNLLPAFTARQHIVLPLELAGERIDRGWFDRLVSTLGIQDRQGHRPSELSGGQQQRVAIARAVLSWPDVVFGDEPTGSLDSRSGQKVLAFLRRGADDFGQSIVMVTHDPIAASFADRVVFLADGRLAGEDARPTADSVLRRLRGLGA